MFNHSFKNEALVVHQNAVDRYNASYSEMQDSCGKLYVAREDAVEKIQKTEALINTLAHTPKEFDTQLGEINEHVQQFHQTEEYANLAYEGALKAGGAILAGVTAGGAVAAAAPTVAMSIATTFGTASTGTAISTLSGAAAQKAALAWIGRMTGGLATKGVITGAGMSSGQAFLALAGPVGWGISAAFTAASLVSLNGRNKKIAEDAMAEAEKLIKARSAVRETTAQINELFDQTDLLNHHLEEQLEENKKYRGMDYLTLTDTDKKALATLIHNTLSLAALLNKVVE